MRKPSGLKEMLPLSPLQEGMLFHALLHDDGPDIYTVQWEIALEGPLDSVALRAAGQALLDRHTNLRARYRHVKSGNAVAVVPRWVELPWRELSLSELDAIERSTELTRCVSEDREQRFDLANPPLMRLTLISLGRTAQPNHHLSPYSPGWMVDLVAAGRAIHSIRAGWGRRRAGADHALP